MARGVAEAARGGPAALALDQRGHGESPLGDPETFSTEALARDVIHAVEVQHGVQRPWILVGHSMGGRVAMAVAAISAREAPDRLAAVVVEDMDCRNREKWGPQPQESEEIEEFDREFASEKEAVAALEKHYDADRVQGWLGSRVRPIAGGGYWSDVNPQRAAARARERAGVRRRFVELGRARFSQGIAVPYSSVGGRARGLRRDGDGLGRERRHPRHAEAPAFGSGKGVRGRRPQHPQHGDGEIHGGAPGGRRRRGEGGGRAAVAGGGAVLESVPAVAFLSRSLRASPLDAVGVIQNQAALLEMLA